MKELKKQLLFALATGSSDPQAIDLTMPTVEAPSVTSLTYARLEWRLSEFKESSIRSIVSSLKNDGMVSSLTREGKTQIRLTTIGREVLSSFFPTHFFKRRRWDEVWRVAIFSGIGLNYGAEQKYRVLRRILKKSGFAQLERGVHISPYALQAADLKEIAKEHAMGLLTVFETRTFVVGDEREWCRQAWNLDAITREYTKLSSQIEKVIAQLFSENGLNEARKLTFCKLSSSVFQMLQQDPGLPQQLLPEDFQALHCWRRFVQLASMIASRE